MLVRDGASSMIKTAELADIKSAHCFNHILHLVFLNLICYAFILGDSRWLGNIPWKSIDWIVKNDSPKNKKKRIRSGRSFRSLSKTWYSPKNVTKSMLIVFPICILPLAYRYKMVQPFPNAEKVYRATASCWRFSQGPFKVSILFH